MDRRAEINAQDLRIPRRYRPSPDQENDTDFLTLSLFNNPSTTLYHHPPPPPPPPPPLIHPTFPSPNPSHPFFINPPILTTAPQDTTAPSPSSTRRPRRARRNPTKTPPEGKSAAIPPPFPWATNSRATVHSLGYLLSKQITSISGDVQCKRCERRYTMELDLQQRFAEIGRFVAENKAGMHHRAPRTWLSPALPTCRYCEQDNSVRPVIADKKRSINWLFLLLGQILGCCTLEQLKYFCKHTKNHRTGAKDRVLYLTYLGLCKQIDPKGPFDI